jgi:hypothetical protein
LWSPSLCSSAFGSSAIIPAPRILTGCEIDVEAYLARASFCISASFDTGFFSYFSGSTAFGEGLVSMTSFFSTFGSFLSYLVDPYFFFISS